MPRRERFSGVAAMPFDCNSFEASLSVTTRLVAKMDRMIDGVRAYFRHKLSIVSSDPIFTIYAPRRPCRHLFRSDRSDYGKL